MIGHLDRIGTKAQCCQPYNPQLERERNKEIHYFENQMMVGIQPDPFGQFFAFSRSILKSITYHLWRVYFPIRHGSLVVPICTTTKIDQQLGNFPMKIRKQTTKKCCNRLFYLQIFSSHTSNSPLYNLVSLSANISMEPLGQLSHQEIEQGLQILKQIETQINHHTTESKHKLLELSNQYYTVIPESFGRSAPPVIDNQQLLHQEQSKLNAILQHHLKQEPTQPIWQFESRHGWYDFDPAASKDLEEVYQSRHPTTRIKSGEWTFDIDFNKMTQTNIDHPNRRTRNIRRVDKGMSRSRN